MGIVSMLVCLHWVWQHTPGVEAVEERAAAHPTRIVSSDGVLLDTIGDVEPLTLQQVPPALVHALLVTEDRRFRDHHGIDLLRIGAAAWATLNGRVQGGSTLTQQLARNLFPEAIGRERTLARKLREAMMACKIEMAYSKDEILSMYISQVPYRYGVTGIGEAARSYLGKPAADLDAADAALLVAMLKGPTQYDPLRRPEAVRQRRDLVLALMARDGWLSPASLAEARARPVVVRMPGPDTATAPHYLREVRRQLNDWAATRGIDLQRAGLQVTVSLDTRWQAIAETAVANQGELLQSAADQEWARPVLSGAVKLVSVSGPGSGDRATGGFAYFWRKHADLWADLARQTPSYQRARAEGKSDSVSLISATADPALGLLMRDKTRLEAGLVALDPRNGAVRAYVGSRDWAADQFDHVGQARRQPGSAFKPFVYGAALQAGMSPEQEYVDTAHTYRLPNGGLWTPTDMGGATQTSMTLRTGLALSKNTITAQVMQVVGADKVVRYAQSMGINRSPLQAVPSLALGTSPVTLLEMAGAYGTLASMGVRREPQLISRIVGRTGDLIEDFAPTPQRVLDPQQAAVLVDMLRGVVEHGTASALRTRFDLHSDIAGKTGTSQHNADGWFMAMAPTVVAGAWVGFNDPRVTMRSSQWGQGGKNALLLVGDFLRATMAAGLLDVNERFPEVTRAATPAPADLDDMVHTPPVDDTYNPEPTPEPVLQALAALADRAPQRAQ